MLKRWGDGMAGGVFAFTSNVDGQFQRAGFDDDALYECHGSIHNLQCVTPCGDDIWEDHELLVEVDDHGQALFRRRTHLGEQLALIERVRRRRERRQFGQIVEIRVIRIGKCVIDRPSVVERRQFPGG